MKSNSRFVSRRQRAIGSLAATIMLSICGCGDFFAEKPAEIQSKAILNELKQIKENPAARNTLPELYRSEPKKLEMEDAVKVFYFAKQNSAETLAKLVERQFSTITADPKGNVFYIPGNLVSHNAATNQVVVDCPNNLDADKVIEFLRATDVPPIQVNIDCLIVERFADVTMDWETTLLMEDLFGENVTVGGKEDSSGNLLPAFPGGSIREAKRSTFGLNIGYWRNRGVEGQQLRILVDMLVSRGYLKILMNPTIETLNGQTAKIRSAEFAPLEKIYLKPGFDEPFSLTDYQWVEDTLEVTPCVYADGSIGLKTKVQIGSKSKPEGIVQASIITERTIDVAENRIKPGESLVIGGIKKTEERAVIRGVPFLKDIPVLGILFSSKDFEEKGTEVTFILTPSISSGSFAHADAVQKVRDKLENPAYQAGLQDVLTDPLGTTAYTEAVEQQAARAEFERLRAEIQRAEAKEEVELVKKKLFETAEEVLAEKSKTAQARAEVYKVRQETEQLKAETEKERAKAEEARKQVEKAAAAKGQEEEAKKRLEEAEKARIAAEKARKEAEEAEKAKKQADQNKQQQAKPQVPESKDKQSPGTEAGRQDAPNQSAPEKPTEKAQ